MLTRVGSGYRPGPAELGWVFDVVREVVVPRLRACVDRLPHPVRDVVRYHLGWYPEETGGSGGTSGKLIRPALTLLSAAAASGTVEQAADAATAIELVHNFALLHDDVMDGALTRRHRETVWWRYGMPKAILAGDALMALGMELFATTPDAVPVACEAIQEMVHGQYQDISFEECDQVSIAQCLAVAGARTAALLRCACELGARCGGGRPAQVIALKRYGWHLGIAFQLTDDLLGIWGDPQTTGRAALADLRAGKKTLPVVAALAASGPDSAELTDLYLRPEPLDDLDLQQVATLVERAGGRAWARAAAEQQCRIALAALAAADPVAAASDALTALASTLAQRGE